MKRHAVTAALLAGAVVCYFAGWGEGIMPLVAAGLLLEGAFWLRLLGRPRPGGSRR